jgi:hypothetical protein
VVCGGCHAAIIRARLVIFVSKHVWRLCRQLRLQNALLQTLLLTSCAVQ